MSFLRPRSTPRQRCSVAGRRIAPARSLPQRAGYGSRSCSSLMRAATIRGTCRNAAQQLLSGVGCNADRYSSRPRKRRSEGPAAPAASPPLFRTARRSESAGGEFSFPRRSRSTAASIGHRLYRRRRCRRRLAQERFAQAVQLLQQRLQEIQSIEDLRHSVASLEQAERLQRALFRLPIRPARIARCRKCFARCTRSSAA